MVKILALDISSRKTGVAVISNGRLMKSSFGAIEPNPKHNYGQKLTFFKGEIEKLIDKYDPDHVIIEDIFKGRNFKTFKTLAMFRGVAIQTIFNKTGKDPASLMPTDARATIGIPTKKEEAFQSLVKKYKLTDFDYENDNDIADAIGLGLAMHQLVKQGIDAKSLRSSRRRKKRKPRRNKKSV